MKSFLNWLSAHKFAAYLTAFLLMILPPVPLYLAANAGVSAWMVFLITMIAAGNLLAVLVR